MDEAKSIEALSLCFTAGVIAGTLLPADAGWAVASCTLVPAAVPLLLRRQLPRMREQVAVPIVLASFLLLGLFCTCMASLPHVPAPPFPDPGNASARLKELLARIPFPSEGTQALLTALLTGDRSGLAPETVSAFRGSGASHLLALSGLHLGIVYLIFDRLTRLTGQFPLSRMVRFVVIILAVGGFTWVTGAAPSLKRAFLFVLINELLRLLGRPRSASRVLCLALLVQLVLEPSAIRSLGFQLSYLAMSGILVLYPILERWYPASAPWDPFRRIWKGAALSISCQVFTAPLVWLRFHTFPRHFLLTNLMALPLTTALVGCAVLTLGLSAAGICPELLIKATDALCTLLQRTLEIIADM